MKDQHPQTYTISCLRKYRANPHEEVLIRWLGYTQQTWEPISAILTSDQQIQESIRAMRLSFNKAKARLLKKGISAEELQVFNPTVKGAEKLQKKFELKYFKKSEESEFSSISGRRKKKRTRRGLKPQQFKQQQKALKQKIDRPELKQEIPRIELPQLLSFKIRLHQMEKPSSEDEFSQLSSYSEYFQEDEKVPQNLRSLKDMLGVSRIKSSLMKGDEVYYQVYFGQPEVKHPILIHQSHLVQIAPKPLAEYLLENINQ